MVVEYKTTFEITSMDFSFGLQWCSWCLLEHFMVIMSNRVEYEGGSNLVMAAYTKAEDGVLVELMNNEAGSSDSNGFFLGD